MVLSLYESDVQKFDVQEIDEGQTTNAAVFGMEAVIIHLIPKWRPINYSSLS